MKELAFIEYISKQPFTKGIGDDCAVLEYSKSKYMLVTCDMIIEGTHFLKAAEGRDIGWKAMAVNISDIASMGGTPKYAALSVGIPPGKGARFLKGMYKGIEDVCNKFNICVIAGDTNKSEKTVINVTLLGFVKKSCLVTRSNAKPGDFIFVTGALGRGKRKHLKFLPRLGEARRLAENFNIHSMIDLSDGLAMDLTRLTRASSVGARVYKSLIPLSEESEPIDKTVTAGEDFELLFTAPLGAAKRIIKDMAKGNLPVTLIGEVVKKKFGVKLVEDDGRAKLLKPEGYKHI